MRTTGEVTMNSATFQGYLIAVARYMDAWAGSEHRRMGQSYFNVLDMYFPNIAAQIRGTDFDPFYSDSLIGSFLAKLYTSYVV